MHVPVALMLRADAVDFRTPQLVATGEITRELAGDPNRWLRQRADFIARMAKEHPELHPTLPVVYHLDRDFVTAARSRQSIHVVDDCNGRDLCGVATNELLDAWESADLRAMFGDQAPSPRRAGRGWREAPGEGIHGATLSVVNRLESHLIATPSRTEMERLKRLGYDTITLVPFGGQRGFAGTEIHRYDQHPAGETDLSMALAAARAHALSMKVMLKPHIWTEGEHGGDPTRIEPRDWAAWFASYEELAVHYAILARDIHAEWLCLGTELSRTESRPEWRRIIAAVRAVYPGRITYAANFDAFERTSFWDAVDAIGIDAYFPLSGDRNATDAMLRAGARGVVARIDAVAAKWSKPVILTELGYPSTSAPWVEPWREDRASDPAPNDQARAFAAILEAVRRSKSIRGFVIWKYESDPERHDERGYLPKGKPAEQVIVKSLH